MPRKKYKPLEVFDYVASSEAVWRDRKTGILLAPGAVQNWPTKAEEMWIVEEYRALQVSRKAMAEVSSLLDATVKNLMKQGVGVAVTSKKGTLSARHTPS